MKRPTLSMVFDLGILIAVLLAGAAIIQQRYFTAPLGEALPAGIELDVAGLQKTGSASAPVVLVEFSDYHCPSCIKYATETMPKVMESLVRDGQVEYVFVNAPAAQTHPKAPELSRAGLCLDRLGWFWQSHDRLFGAGKYGKPGIPEGLSGLAIPRDELSKCLASAWPDTALARDLDVVHSMGISVTPSFFFGRRAGNGVNWLIELKGAQSFAVFKELVNETAATPPAAAGR